MQYTWMITSTPIPLQEKNFPTKRVSLDTESGLSLSDWRRNNVNFLIQELHQTISQRKPWSGSESVRSEYIEIKKMTRTVAIRTGYKIMTTCMQMY